MTFNRFKTKHLFEVGLFFLFFLFSFWLMFHTFGYTEDGNLRLASRVWSDFGAHIPLIRSFSLGENWPPQYPLFPGEKIRYHFLFYAIVGLLERMGIRIDYALNIPSAVGFGFLLLFIYVLAQRIYKKTTVAILSVIFFLFNGTLSFLKYFHTFPTILSAIKDIPSVHDFPSFGPWDGGPITAFGNLNVYTNQRHLGPSFAIVLFVMLLLLRQKSSRKTHHSESFHPSFISSLFPTTHFSLLTSVVLALLLSSLLFLNQAALLPAIILMGGIFLFIPSARISLLVASVLSLPFLWYFFVIGQPTGQPVFEPGYLSQKPFSFLPWIQFWIQNLGLHMLLIPIGMILTPKPFRWLAIPTLVIFALPNTYRFSTDMINNHKLINFFMVFGSMYSAQALTTGKDIVMKVTNKQSKKLYIPRIILRTSIFLLLIGGVIFLTLSGIIDFFVVKNDYSLYLADIPKNKDATFIQRVVPPGAIVLNSTWFYHPASIAGRAIYNGYAFFTWSAGYDTYKREGIVKQIYRSEDKREICQLLKQAQITYVELNHSPDDYLKPISEIWQSMTPILYENPKTGIKLFQVQDLCR